MKKKGIISSILAFTTVAMLALGSCGGTKGGMNEQEMKKSWESLKNLQSGENIAVKLWGRGTTTEEQNYRDYIKTFNADQTEISAELEWFSETGYMQTVRGQSTNLPDVFMLSNQYFIEFAASGQLADLTPYVGTGFMQTSVDDGILDNIYEQGYSVYYYDSANRRVGKSDTAKLYGLPKDQGPFAMFVNQDLLQETVDKYNQTAPQGEELSVERIMSADDPMTFDEFLHFNETTQQYEGIAMKLKSVLDSGCGVISDYNTQNLVYSNNASYFVDDTGKQTAVDSENFIEAIRFKQDLYKAGIIPEKSDGETGFTAGNYLFHADGGVYKTSVYADLVKFDWDIIPVLCGNAEGAVSTAYVGGMCYAISNNCEHKDAALALVEWLVAGKKSQTMQYKSGQCIPNVKSLAQNYITCTDADARKITGIQNRKVWISVVDGVGANDKISGKYCAESFTYTNEWLTKLNAFMGGTETGSKSFWKKDGDAWVDVSTALTSYKSKVQEYLDFDQRKLERLG